MAIFKSIVMLIELLLTLMIGGPYPLSRSQSHFRCSKKQILVAKSFAEAEYCNLAPLAASEVLRIQSLLQELQVSLSKSVIYCDNQSTFALSHILVLQLRTKLIELGIFFVRDMGFRCELDRLAIWSKIVTN